MDNSFNFLSHTSFQNKYNLRVKPLTFKPCNDVTLVTSYGYYQSLRINDICDVCLSLRSVRLGGYCVRRWVGVCTGTMKPTMFSSRYPYSLYYGSTPGLWSVLHWRVSINYLSSLFIFSFECAVLYTWGSWHDFIRTVILRLLSRGTNFHNNKNIWNYTQDGHVNFTLHTL